MSGQNDLSARMDNAKLDPALVAAGDIVLGKAISTWLRAGRNEQFLFQSHNDLNDIADAMYAFAEFDGQTYWVLENDISGFPDPAQYVLVGFFDNGQVSALIYFDDWPSNWTPPENQNTRATGQSLKDMAHLSSEKAASAPKSTKQIAATAGMSFVKGGVVSAIVITPFFGPWIALGTACAFSMFCVGLALKRQPQKPKKKETYEIVQGDSCYPKVKRVN